MPQHWLQHSWTSSTRSFQGNASHRRRSSPGIPYARRPVHKERFHGVSAVADISCRRIIGHMRTMKRFFPATLSRSTSSRRARCGSTATSYVEPEVQLRESTALNAMLLLSRDGSTVMALFELVDSHIMSLLFAACVSVCACVFACYVSSCWAGSCRSCGPRG